MYRGWSLIRAYISHLIFVRLWLSLISKIFDSEELIKISLGFFFKLPWTLNLSRCVLTSQEESGLLDLWCSIYNFCLFVILQFCTCMHVHALINCTCHLCNQFLRNQFLLSMLCSQFHCILKHQIGKVVQSNRNLSTNVSFKYSFTCIQKTNCKYWKFRGKWVQITRMKYDSLYMTLCSLASMIDLCL